MFRSRELLWPKHQWRCYVVTGPLTDQTGASSVAPSAASATGVFSHEHHRACLHLTKAKQAPAVYAGRAETAILDVGEMKCGGCSAAVKRLLLQQPGVQGAAVNLLTETAVIQLAHGATALQPEVAAQRAAEALTAKGFPSKPRSSESSLAEDASVLSSRKERELQKR